MDYLILAVLRIQPDNVNFKREADPQVGFMIPKLFKTFKPGTKPFVELLQDKYLIVKGLEYHSNFVKLDESDSAIVPISLL